MMAFPLESLAMGEEAGDREAMATMAFVLALRARGVRDLAVLGAMERVPRDLFAPSRFRDLARSDVALPLGCGQTMSAPSTIAAMLAALAPAPGQRVLEIGTGSGYVTALLARIGCAVVSLERFATLAAEAAARLPVLGIDEAQARVMIGDGCAEPPAAVLPAAVFDRILVNGALAEIPPALCARLAPGGCLVGAIVGAEGATRLAVVERGEDGLRPARIEGRLRLPRLVGGLARAL